MYCKKFLKTQNKVWYDIYKHYWNALISLVSKSKKVHQGKYFQDNQQNSKTMWSKINEVLQNEKRLDETLHIFDNRMTIPDPTKIANKFNNYFTNVIQDLLKNLGKTSFRIT